MADMQVKKNGEAGGDSERRRHLSSMLRDLVKKEGQVATASMLGVNRKTVARANESGHITDHVALALEALLGPDVGAETPGKGGLEDRVKRLEADMEELRHGLETLKAAVEREGTDKPVEGSETLNEYEKAGPGPEAIPSVQGMGQSGPSSERRVDPDIVTEEPASDDPEVYGPAWPLVEEWRSLRAGHPHSGKSMSWLLTEERLLVLELAMLEEHGLTLPPETQPLRGFGRRGQTGWRRKALHDTRRRLGKRRLLRWVRRALTLGIWWK